MKVMFVCTGNSCRSPMAELYFNDLCRKNGISSLQAVSAGLCAWPGGAISRPAAAVMESFGIDCRAFRSQKFSPELAGDIQLIVTMTPGHAAAVCDAVPAVRSKVKVLSDFAEPPFEGGIPDPFGGDVPEYRRIFGTMKVCLDSLFQQLKG